MLTPLPISSRFQYELIDFSQWIADLSSFTGVPVHDGRLEYPSSMAKGYVKAKVIEPGLSFRVFEYTLNTDLIVERQAGTDFQLILQFIEYTAPQSVSLKIGDKLFTSRNRTNQLAAMTTNLLGDELFLKKGTTLKGCTIQVGEAWLKRSTDPANYEKIEFLKTFTHLSGFLPVGYNNIFQSIFTDQQSLFPELSMTNKVTELLEKFLINIYKKDLKKNPVISAEDYHAMAKIEKQLVINYKQEFPSIQALARMVLMSESKFKKLFKKAYGIGPFEYYQKNRMQKAKEMILERKFSISAIGNQLGYQNLSNFSSCFKKEHGELPSDLLRLKATA
jgi:AraC-like DNA-binding protein